MEQDDTRMREQIEHWDARAREHRTRRTTLELIAPDGPLPAGTMIRWRLERHAFRFGINMHWFGRTDEGLQRQCRDAAARLMNAATIPCYWGQSLYDRLPPFESEPGETRIDEVLDAGRWCLDNDMRPKGHPLIFVREPAWVGSLPPDRQEAAYWAHVQEIVAAGRGVIDSWEVVNEPTHGFAAAAGKDAPGMALLGKRYGPAGVIAEAHRRAVKANPDAELIQNDWCEQENYAAICREAIDAGARINAIGIQHHALENPHQSRDLTAMLDRFAALGRPVHITEIMIPSGAAEFRERFHWKPLQGWTTTAEGEARQARETELLYRQLFAHPAVKAITWWDLTDAFACLGIPCGLLRRNGAPKPAYERLQRLIHEEWRSSGTIATDEKGKACAEGYAGHYTVVAEVNGTRLRGRFHLGDRGDESPIRVDMERP